MPQASPPLDEARPLLGMGLSALEQWAKQHGQAAFRGRQLHDWLYAKGARSLDQVSVLPKAFREELAAQPPAGAFDWMGRSRELHRSIASDGTTKLLLGTHDQLSIETVGIPAEGRLNRLRQQPGGMPDGLPFLRHRQGGPATLPGGARNRGSGAECA